MKSSFISKLSFWGGVLMFLTILFGYSARNYLHTFYFVTAMLPIAIATSYFFNNYLVPRYLYTGRYLRFALYFIYTIIISLWLEMIVVVIAFIVLANYQYAALHPQSKSIVQMGVLLYLIVFVDGFRVNFIHLRKQQQQLKQMEHQQRDDFIIFKVNRKNVQITLADIFLIESLSDFVKVHTLKQTYITREKISSLALKLPPYFLRTHRSYLVNTHKIASYNKESMVVNDQKIPISRTYKAKVLQFLDQ